MAVTMTLSASLKLAYDDATSRTVTFSDLTEQGIGMMKSKVVALNQTLADATANTAYRDTFISDNGSPISKIAAASYTVTSEEVIYSG